MRNTLLVSAFFAASLGCAMFVPVIGAYGHGWHGDHGNAMESHVYDKLDLSDAQRNQLRQLTEQDFAQARPQMQALRQARRAYASAIPGTAAYQTAVGNLAQAEADAARTRTTQRADLRARIYQLLTPAQRNQLAQIQQQRETHRQQRKQSRQDNPPSSAAPAAASSR